MKNFLRANRSHSKKLNPQIDRACGPVIEALESRRLMSTTPGLPDTTYNSTGVNTLTAATIPNLYYGAFLAVATQTDGKSVAVGYEQKTTGTTGTDLLLARFNTDGTLDTTFGGSGTGFVITDIGSQNQTSANLKIQADGKILALTSSGTLVQNLQNSWIVRFNANGTLDTAFGGNNTGYIASVDTFSALALQGDGSILAAGSTTPQTSTVADAFVERYSKAGVLDTTFGTNGRATKEVGSNSTTDDAFIYSIVQDADGNILLGGTRGNLNVANNQATDGLIIRFTKAGVLDTTFGGGNGFVSANALNQDFFQTVFLLPGGNIGLAGNSNVSTNTRNVAILEFNSSGSVIHTYQPTVYGTTTSGTESNNDTALLQSDGKIVGESGVFGTLTDSQSFIYRLTTAGTLDATYGSGGKFDVATNQSIVLEGASLQANGAMIAAGAQLAAASGTYFPVIARYNGDAAATTNGSLSGNVFNDTNADGSADNGETNLAGVTVYIDANNNGSFDAGEAATVTDANGNYAFSNLAAGTYNVRGVAPTGYVQTFPAGADVVGVAADKNTIAVPIGFAPATATVSGKVYADANSDGSFDNGEAGQSGVTVTLSLNSQAVKIYTKVSDASGNYNFTGLPAGVYTLTETVPSGYTQTQPATTAYTVTVSAGGTITSENFGNFKPAAVAPTLAIDNVSHNEGNTGTTSFTFTVTRTGDTSGVSTVAYTTANGTATTADADYTAKSGTLTFGAGVTTQTITVLVNGDTHYEADETFAVNLSAPTNATITTATGTGTIVNDDAEPTISINNVSKNEGNTGTTAFVFTVTRVGDPTVPFTVDYSTADGSATVVDGDYQAASGKLTFGAGVTTQTITVLVNGDTKFETDETFTVNLTNLVYTTGAEVGTIASPVGTGTILNDDTAPVSPTVSINDVALNEGNAGTTAFVFTVTRSGDATVPFTVDYTTADGSATAPSDYTAASGTLTFNAGDLTKTITVLVNGDTTVEANETFTVMLSNYQTIQFTAVPALKANLTTNPIIKAVGTGTILNDDVAVASPTVSIDDVSKNEGNTGTTAFVFTVTRSGDTTVPFTVDYITADGSATAPSDYTAASGTLTFNAGDVTKTITVLVNGDTTFEANETFTVTLSNFQTIQFNVLPAVKASLIADPITKAVGTGTILNDDTAVTPPTVSINDVKKTEGNAGTTAFVFTVTRSGDTSVPFTVDYITADGSATAPSDYTATSGTLTFNAGVTTQTITVLVNGDTTVESDETFTVNLSNFQPITIVSAKAAATVAVSPISKAVGVGTIVNDDSAVVPPALSVNDVSKSEGNAGTTAYTFTVTRSGDTSGAGAVHWATADGTAIAPIDYTAASGDLSFAAGQKTATFTVLVNGDTTVEKDETFLVNLTNASGATIADGQGVGTIKNDDSVKPVHHSRPYIVIDNPRVKEGNNGLTAMTFTLTLTHASSKTVTVQYKTTNGPLGDSKHDYVAKTGTVTFKPGQTTATVTIYIRGNTFKETNETFFVDLFNATNAGIGDKRGTGTILNDD